MCASRSDLQITILVPVLNERHLLPGFFCHLQQRIGDSAIRCELILVDGGSTDGSQSLLRAYRDEQVATSPEVHFLEVSGGRYKQLNAALELALGDVIVCCPVDIRLSSRALTELVEAVRAGVSHGCFWQQSASPDKRFKFQDLGARLRARFSANAYMDQVPFFRRDVIEGVRGFQDCGSYDTADLCRRIGRPQSYRLLRSRALSSCRGWKTGFLRQTVRHQLSRLRYWRRLLSSVLR